VFAPALMIVGPNLRPRVWLPAKFGLGPLSVAAWRFLRWSMAIAFTVFPVELIYFLAPNIRQQFRRTLPGAIIAVGATPEEATEPRGGR
jgi:membrane protein